MRFGMFWHNLYPGRKRRFFFFFNFDGNVTVDLNCFYCYIIDIIEYYSFSYNFYNLEYNYFYAYTIMHPRTFLCRSHCMLKFWNIHYLAQSSTYRIKIDPRRINNILTFYCFFGIICYISCRIFIDRTDNSHVFTIYELYCYHYKIRMRKISKILFWLY